MSSLAMPPMAPHFYEQQRLSPTRSSQYIDGHHDIVVANTRAVPNTTPSNPRKRKASPSSEDDEMTTSPQPSHARLPAQSLSRKRVRANLVGRPLTVDRLLETLDRDTLRSIIKTLSDRNSQLRDEILHIAPRPSITSTLDILRDYVQKLRNAFPLDPNPRSDYSYDRVRPQWNDLLDALTDFTPHFLPPNEPQAFTSLDYLDGVTNIIHELPEWDTSQYNMAKQEAYESIARAWATVIKEASKRGGGFHLDRNGWEGKIRTHWEKSGGLMQEAYDELGTALGWLGPSSGATTNTSPQVSQSRIDIRNQLFSGTYGTDQGQPQQSPQQQPFMNMRTGGNW